MLIPFFIILFGFCYVYYCLPILMPPNINARIKTLRTALFNHIGFILVKKEKEKRGKVYYNCGGKKQTPKW